jgi:hypothetical protein
MKQLVWLMLVVVVFLSSCASPHYTLGMSQQDFLLHNHTVTLVSSPNNETVYKKTKYGLGHLPSPEYFHFKNDKLVKVDGDIQQPGLSYVGLQ